MEQRGNLYVFEGPDGVGKSTLSKWFAKRLRGSGRRCHLMAFPGKEAGTLGKLIYAIHHKPKAFGIRSIFHPS